MSNDPRRNQAPPSASGSSAGSRTPTNAHARSDAEMYQYYAALQSNTSQQNQVMQQQAHVGRNNMMSMAHQQHLQHISRGHQLAASRHRYPLNPAAMQLHNPRMMGPSAGTGGMLNPYMNPSALGMNAPYAQMIAQNESISRRESQPQGASDLLRNQSQNSSVKYNVVLNEYTHLNSLMSGQQLLLDAHIAEVAYQQAFVEKQLLSACLRREHESIAEIRRVQEARNQVHLLRQQQIEEDECKEDGKESSDVVRQNTGVIQSETTEPSEKSHADRVGVQDEILRESSEKSHAADRVDARMGEDEVVQSKVPVVKPGSSTKQNDESVKASTDSTKSVKTSNRAKRKHSPLQKKQRGAAKVVRKIYAAPLPQCYKGFIDAIAANPRAENIVDQFNKKLRTEQNGSSLIQAVSEDIEKIQQSSDAKHQHYNAQLETMNARLDMYDKMEELIDKIIGEQSTSSQAKNPRMTIKAHIREVTMDLIQLCLKNYQLLEDNMDRLLGERNENDRVP